MAEYDIGDALSRIENILLQSMSRNLHRHLGEEQDEGFRWSMWQAEQMTALGNWSARNLKQHGTEFTRINDAAIELLRQSGAEAELAEERRLLGSGVQQAAAFFSVPEDKTASLLNAVRHDLSRAEHSILRQADDLYRKAVFDAHLYLQTGSGTLNSAIDMAVQDLMAQGIRAVTYRNGHRVEASVYARMALRSANVRAKLTGEGRARDRFGVHTVLVSPSGIACEKCAKWMGKVLVDDVYCSGTAEEADAMHLPLLSEAIAQGLLHPQCNCTVHTYHPGISKLPDVTDQDREDAVRRYKLTQKQRYHERQIRKWKRAEQSAPDEAARKAVHAKVRSWQKANKALCDSHPDILRRDYMREKIWDVPESVIVPDVIEKNRGNRLTLGTNSDTMDTKEVMPVQQAKKRDHKIFITDTAISKIGYVKLSDFTDEQIVRMQERHCALLKQAQTKNHSNEVLIITDLDFLSEVSILGEEYKVSPGKNPFAVSVINNAERQTLIYMHNHPSTNLFSLGDIDTFICEQAVKTMTVVTNQGEVYAINKLSSYTFQKARKLMKEIYNSFPEGEIDDAKFVAAFLKRCREGGIEYAKSKS